MTLGEGVVWVDLAGDLIWLGHAVAEHGRNPIVALARVEVVEPGGHKATSIVAVAYYVANRSVAYCISRTSFCIAIETRARK